MVRRVHSCQPMDAVPVLALLFGGCIITPDLSVQTDGGINNSPPAIMAISSDDQQLGPSPGPVNFGVMAPSTALVTLLDTDLDNVLTVRWFVDYSSTNQLPARVECKAAASGNALRTASCDLHTLCVGNDVGPEHDLQIAVFDHDMRDPGTPPYQDDGPSGLSTSVFYHLNCFTQ